jgi:hypothetical protein
MHPITNYEASRLVTNDKNRYIFIARRVLTFSHFFFVLKNIIIKNILIDYICITKRRTKYLDNYYYHRSNEQINCVYEKDKYCVTDTHTHMHISKVMSKKLCRSVRPLRPYVDIDNADFIQTIMISGHNRDRNAP